MIVNHTGSREEKKITRANRVAKIVVTVMRGETALHFDGDETSQNRLNRFVQALRRTEQPGMPWILADNTVVDVTVEEMEQALDLALQQQHALWINS